MDTDKGVRRTTHLCFICVSSVAENFPAEARELHAFNGRHSQRVFFRAELPAPHSRSGINYRIVGPTRVWDLVFPALQAGLGKLPGRCPCMFQGVARVCCRYTLLSRHGPRRRGPYRNRPTHVESQALPSDAAICALVGGRIC